MPAAVQRRQRSVIGLMLGAVIGDARVFGPGCADAGVKPPWRAYQSVSAIDWSRSKKTGAMK